MRLTGLGLARFIVFHILHLTTGTIAPVPFDKHDVYRNVVGGFGVGWVAAVYLGAMALVGAHVWHGAWASLRSLGMSRPSPQPKRRPVAWLLALLLWAASRAFRSRSGSEGALAMELDARIPGGPLERKWDRRLREGRLVGPSNRRKYTLLVVGSGLAGASAAATLAELGYHVHCFCFQDSPRRAHSIAAQGGINAAKNYRNDGDSVWRLFYDTRQRRRLPLARGECLPARPGQRSTSSTSASRRASRSRASTAAFW